MEFETGRMRYIFRDYLSSYGILKILWQDDRHCSKKHARIFTSSYIRAHQTLKILYRFFSAVSK